MVYVVGCNHGIQPRQHPLSAHPRTNDQKSRFAALLTEIIDNRSIEVICEEWGHPDLTIARGLAEDRGMDDRWANINTCRQDLQRMGIPKDYLYGPYSQEDKERWVRDREKFMVDRISEKRGAAQAVLVICGFRHMDPLSNLLGQHGGAVETVDYRNLPWYEQDVFPDDCQLENLIKDLSRLPEPNGG